jgi:hypothetical protein
MIPYILVMYIFDWKSNKMQMDSYVFFISLYLLYMFRVLFTPIIRSTNCRVQLWVCMIVMVCEKVDNLLEQILPGAPAHFQHGWVRTVDIRCVRSTCPLCFGWSVLCMPCCSPNLTVLKVCGCPSQNLLQWIIQLLTHHNNHAFPQL